MSILISSLAAGRRLSDETVRPFLPAYVLVVMAAISLALVAPYVEDGRWLCIHGHYTMVP